MNINLQTQKQTIRRPQNYLAIELDAAQIYPSDPGQGTPILVVHGQHTATLECAVNEGELAGRGNVLYKLSDLEMKWLDSVYDQCNEWLDTQYERIIGLQGVTQ